MTLLKAFVARSFDPKDEQRIGPILEFLKTFHAAGFICESADQAEVESVSIKVRRMIEDSQVFVGFFTRRHPVFASRPRLNWAWRILSGNMQPEKWSSPPWVLQESGYAVGLRKSLILLREEGVEIPGLQGDLEYVPFESENPTPVLKKLNEMVLGLLAKSSGQQVTVTLVQREDAVQVAQEPKPAAVDNKAPEHADADRSIIGCVLDMQRAAKTRDFRAMEKAWKEGSALIAAGEDWVDQLGWDCWYQEYRFEAGATDAVSSLKSLHECAPQKPEPVLSIARCFTDSGEPQQAASFYSEAASLSEDSGQRAAIFVNAAKAYRQIKDYPSAHRALDLAFPDSSGEVWDDAVRERYLTWKDSDNDFLAFAFAESALQENPQLSIRFALGLDYHRKALIDMALFHFKFIHERDIKNSSSLHNLALMYAESKLPLKSVQLYKKAISMGETLSAANLGSMYLDAGMSDEAAVVLEEARSVESHDGRVEKIMADAITREEVEKSGEKALLEKVEETRQSLVAMGKSMARVVAAIEGRWHFPFGDIDLLIFDGKLHGRAEITSNVPAYGAPPFSLGAKPTTKTDIYKFVGTLSGAVCHFELEIEPQTLAGGVLAMLAGPRTKSGFIAFEPSGRSGSYIELADGKLGKAEEITKSM